MFKLVIASKLNS